MADWMTIRVDLLGRAGTPLRPAPGRILLASADHAFAELAEAVDVAFGRWDLTPLHEFGLEGRRLTPGGEADDPDVEDSDELTLGEAGLRPGVRFRYTFDLGEGWLHDCLVQDTGVDAVAVYGEEPDIPVPLFGWGTIPDQYGRESEDDENPAAAGSAAAAAAAAEVGDPFAGDQGGPDTWALVDAALDGRDRSVPLPELTAAAGRLRSHAGLALAPYDLLFAASGLDAGALPTDDVDLWCALAAGVVQPATAAPLDPEAEAAWAVLEPADWAGAVIGLVLGDVGQSAEPEAVVHLLTTVPEIPAARLTGEDRAAVTEALGTVVRLWQALGAVDDDRRLTALGRWGLPEALRTAWSPGPQEQARLG